MKTKTSSSDPGQYECQVLRRYTQQYGLFGVHKVISIYVHCDLDLWPLTLKINMNYPPTMDNMCATFEEDTLNGLVSIRCSQGYFHTCSLWPWPLTLKINRDHPPIMTKVCGKFNKDTWNAIVFIMFTRSRCDGRTEPRKRYYIPITTCAGTTRNCLRWYARQIPKFCKANSKTLTQRLMKMLMTDGHHQFICWNSFSRSLFFVFAIWPKKCSSILNSILQDRKSMWLRLKVELGQMPLHQQHWKLQHPSYQW